MAQLGFSQSSNFFIPSGQVNFRFNSSDCPRILERFNRNEAWNESFEDVVANELCKQVPGSLGILSTLNYNIELKENDVIASWNSNTDVEWQAQGLGSFREVSKCRTISLPSASTQISAALNGNSRLTRKLDFLFEPFFVDVDMSARFKAAVRVNEKLRTNYFGGCADPTTADAYDLTANASTAAKVKLMGNLGLRVSYLGKGYFQVTTNPYLIATPTLENFDFKFEQSGRDHGIFAFHQVFNMVGSFINMAIRGFADKISGAGIRGRTDDAFIDSLFALAEVLGGTFDRIATLSNKDGGYQQVVDKVSDAVKGEIITNYLNLNPYAKRINDQFAAQIAAKVPRSTTFYVIPYLRSKLDPILTKNGIPASIITNAHMEQLLDSLIQKGSLDEFVKLATEIYWETDIKPRFFNTYGRQPTENEKSRILSKIATKPLLQVIAEANEIIVDIPTSLSLPAGSATTIPLPTRDADGDPVSYQLGLTFYNPPSYQEFLARLAHLPPCEPNDTVCEEFRLPDCGVYVDAPKCVTRYWLLPRFQTNNAIYGSVQIDSANSRLIYSPSSFPSSTYDAFTLRVSEVSNPTRAQSIEIILQFKPNPLLINNLFQFYMGRPATELESSDAIDKMNAGISSMDLDNYIKSQPADLAARNAANQQAWSDLYTKASAKHATLQSAPTLEWKNNLFVFATEGMDLQKPFVPLNADISVPTAKLTAQKIKRLDALVDSVSLPAECSSDAHWRIEGRVRYAADIVTTECMAQAQYRECSRGVYTPWSGTYAFANCKLKSIDTDNDGVVDSADLCPGENDTLRSSDGLCPAAYLARENSTNSTRWKNLADRALAVDLTFKGVYTQDWSEARTMFLNGGLNFPNKDLTMVLATSVPEALARRSQIEVFLARLTPFEACAFKVGGCSAPLSCGPTPSGTSVTRVKFQSATDPVACKSEVQSSTCNNGTFTPWTGTYTFDSCSVPAACGPTPSGTSITRVKYLSSSDPVACKSEVQSSTCNNGTFSAWTGTYTFDSCKVLAACGSTPSGSSITRTKYLATTDPVACKSEVQTSTCTNGVLSPWTGTFTNDTCRVLAKCGTTVSGQYSTRIRYKTGTDPVQCLSETQSALCTDGVLGAWSGTYSFTSCTVALTPTNLYNGETALFGIGTTWDTTKSTVTESTLSPYSGTKHIRFTLNNASYWGAGAYYFSKTGTVDVSKYNSITLALKSSQAVTAKVYFISGDLNKESKRVDLALTTAYKVFTLDLLAMQQTGFDRSKLKAIIVTTSLGNTVTIRIDADSIIAK
jgi:hypothetical protein